MSVMCTRVVALLCACLCLAGFGCISAPRRAAGAGGAPRSAATPACYRADRPLGYDEASIRRAATPGQSTSFRLLEGGRVDRPGILGGPQWAARSRWDRAGDTLRVRLSTGTAGWALRLVATPSGADSAFAGQARYLSDAVARPRTSDTAQWQLSPPAPRAVAVRREPCEARGEP